MVKSKKLHAHLVWVFPLNLKKKLTKYVHLYKEKR